MSKNIALVTKKPQSLITNEKTSTPHVTKNRGLFQVILSILVYFAAVHYTLSVNSQFFSTGRSA